MLCAECSPEAKQHVVVLKWRKLNGEAEAEQRTQGGRLYTSCIRQGARVVGDARNTDEIRT